MILDAGILRGYPKERAELYGKPHLGARYTHGKAYEALSIVESLTDDSYQCFALLEDGTVLDLRGRFPGCVEVAE